MAGSLRFRARLVAALVAGLALAAGSAGAQEGSRTTEERLEALERQVEADRRRARRAPAWSSSSGASS
jgi:Ni/Co efflux regulator RcnB